MSCEPPIQVAVVYMMDWRRRGVWLSRRFADQKLNPNRWQTAGGHVESNETPRLAAIRELREETGIATTRIEKFRQSDHVNAAGKPYIVHSYSMVCGIFRRPKQLEPTKATGWKFFTFEEVDALVLCVPGLDESVQVLRKIFS